MKYYKIQNGLLDESPKSLVVNGVVKESPTSEDYLSQGWKQLLTKEKPTTSRYYKSVPSYTETSDSIILDWLPTISVSLENAKLYKIQDIRSYDSSKIVNNFTINNIEFWFTKIERMSIMHSVQCEELLNKEWTKLYNKQDYIEISIENVKSILRDVELYAKETFEVTQSHIKAVSILEDIEEIVDYNYISNYPATLAFEGIIIK